MAKGEKLLSLIDAPYFSLLKTRLNFLNDRQKILADNVANASTPKFVPKDMDQDAFNQSVSRMIPNSFGGVGINPVSNVSLATTNAGHISAKTEMISSNAIKKPDSEVTMDGNAVVLEEQMIKVADTRMNYDIALGLYQKGLQLMRLAARKPGG